MIVPFNKLNEADLVVDTVYEGGTVNGKGSEVLSILTVSNKEWKR